MIRNTCLALLLLANLAAPVSAEQSDTRQEKKDTIVFRVNVGLVQVDAVVTDKKDRPVTDLTADDFILLQDGKPQKITNFSLVRLPGFEIPRPAEKKTASKSRNVPPPPPLKFDPQKLRRTVALVVDDLGLSFPNIVRVREALKKWVEDQMQPGDLVAVIQTGSGLGSMQQFTSEKRMLQAAIGHINFNIISRVGSSSFSPVSAMPGQLSSQQDEERRRGLTLGTLGAIRYVVDGLGNLPGRKSLILFSENLAIQFNEEHQSGTEAAIFNMNNSNSVADQLQRLIEAANRAAVVVHTIDPRGVVYTETTAEDSLGGMSMEDINGVASDRRQQLLDSRDGLAIVSRKTGGLFIRDSNLVDRALQEAANDGEAYYLIGYQPDVKTASEMEKGKARYHNIQVKVKRPGLRVRSRSGFFSITDAQSAPLTRRDRMIRALYSPFAPGELRVRLTTLYSQTRDNVACVNALLHFDADKLSFSEGPGGEQTAVIDIMGGLYDAEGRQIDFTDKRWNLTVSARSFSYVKRNGMAFLMRVPVKEPGAYQMRIVLSDTGNGRIGSASHFVEVPKTDKGDLALSGIVLAADVAKPKSIGDREEGILADREVNGTPAVRVFRSGEMIGWAYQILNARTGSDKQSQLQTYVRLFHDNQEVFEAKPKDLTVEAGENGERLIGAGQMYLKSLPPGDYALQVIVLDMLAKEKHRMAVQSIDFEMQDPSSRVTKLAP